MGPGDGRDDNQKGKGGIGTMNLKTWVVLILLAGVVTFVVQNNRILEVHFLIWGFRVSRAVVFVAAFVVGTIFGLLTASLGKK